MGTRVSGLVSMDLGMDVGDLGMGTGIPSPALIDLSPSAGDLVLHQRPRNQRWGFHAQA